MVKKMGEEGMHKTHAWGGGKLSRRGLAARVLGVAEGDILASKDTNDGGMIVVLVSGPKLRIGAEQLMAVDDEEMAKD